MKVICDKSLDELARKVASACEAGPITSLILHGVFPYEQVDSEFIKMNNKRAEDWQNPVRPDSLYFSHGEYIDRCGIGSGREFVINELKTKRDSNRACFSLINMEDIIGSGDNPIPSFLILQFGFAEGEPNKLLVTAYFRALEVSQFLPVNLAEICQNVRYLRTRFPEIECFELTVIAFRAHYIKDFHCLRKTEIDAADPVDITLAVEHQELDTLRRWLNDKIAVTESVVTTNGIETLYKALERCKSKYKNKASLIENVKEALDNLKQLKRIRELSSHSQRIRELEAGIKEKLQAAIDELGDTDAS